MFEKGIIDPAKVTRSTLENTASIAALVLTSELSVTDIPEPPTSTVQRGWILATHNAADFTLLHVRWRRRSTASCMTAQHAGILFPSPCTRWNRVQ